MALDYSTLLEEAPAEAAGRGLDYSGVPDYSGVLDYSGVPDYSGVLDYSGVPDYSGVLEEAPPAERPGRARKAGWSKVMAESTRRGLAQSAQTVEDVARRIGRKTFKAKGFSYPGGFIPLSYGERKQTQPAVDEGKYERKFLIPPSVELAEDLPPAEKSAWSPAQRIVGGAWEKGTGMLPELAAFASIGGKLAPLRAAGLKATEAMAPGVLRLLARLGVKGGVGAATMGGAEALLRPDEPKAIARGTGIGAILGPTGPYAGPVVLGGLSGLEALLGGATGQEALEEGASTGLSLAPFSLLHALQMAGRGGRAPETGQNRQIGRTGTEIVPQRPRIIDILPPEPSRIEHRPAYPERALPDLGELGPGRNVIPESGLGVFEAGPEGEVYFRDTPPVRPPDPWMAGLEAPDPWLRGLVPPERPTPEMPAGRGARDLAPAPEEPELPRPAERPTPNFPRPERIAPPEAVRKPPAVIVKEDGTPFASEQEAFRAGITRFAVVRPVRARNGWGYVPIETTGGQGHAEAVRSDTGPVGEEDVVRRGAGAGGEDIQRLAEERRAAFEQQAAQEGGGEEGQLPTPVRAAQLGAAGLDYAGALREPPTTGEQAPQGQVAPPAAAPVAPPPAQEAKPPAAKQPWEMSRKEWWDRGQKPIYPGQKPLSDTEHSREQWPLVHERYVMRAIEEGKSVPRAVLEEYKGEPWADAALAKMGKPAEVGPPVPVAGPVPGAAPAGGTPMPDMLKERRRLPRPGRGETGAIINPIEPLTRLLRGPAARHLTAKGRRWISEKAEIMARTGYLLERGKTAFMNAGATGERVLRETRETEAWGNALAGKQTMDFEKTADKLYRKGIRWLSKGNQFAELYRRSGPEAMPTAETKAFAEMWNRIHNESGKLAEELGVMVEDPDAPGGRRRFINGRMPWYFPEMKTPAFIEAVSKGRGPVFDAILKETGRTQAEIQGLLEENDIQSALRRFGPFEWRRIHVPDYVTTEKGERVQCIQTNPFEVIPQWISGASRRLGIINQWGQDTAQTAWDEFSIQLKAEGHEHAGRIADKVWAELNGNVRRAERQFMREHGLGFVDGMENIAMTAMLSASTVAQVTLGWIPFVTRLGMDNGLLQLIRMAAGTASERMELGFKSQAELEMTRGMGGWGRKIIGHTSQTDYLSGKIGKFGEKAMKYEWFEGSNRQLDKWGSLMALKNFMDGIMALRHPKSGLARKLWGMDAEGVRRQLKRNYNRTDVDVDRMVNSGIQYKDYEAILKHAATDPKMRQAYLDLASAAQTTVSKGNIFHESVLEHVPWMNHRVAQMFLRFQSMVRQIGNLTADAVAEASHGNIAPLTRLLVGAAAGGALKQACQDAIFRVTKREREEKDTGTPGGAVARKLDENGIDIELARNVGKILDWINDAAAGGLLGNTITNAYWAVKFREDPGALEMPLASWWAKNLAAPWTGKKEDTAAMREYKSLGRTTGALRGADAWMKGPLYEERQAKGRRALRVPGRSRRLKPPEPPEHQRWRKYE